MSEAAQTVTAIGFNGYGAQSHPTAGESLWFDITGAGAGATQDASGAPQDAVADIAADKWQFTRQRGSGSTLQLRLKYNDDTTAITGQCTVRVFAWSEIGEDSDAPTLLTNQASAYDIELTADPSNDPSEDGYLYTIVDIPAQSLDCLNCNRFRAGVVVAFNGNGTDSDCVIQGRWL